MCAPRRCCSAPWPAAIAADPATAEADAHRSDYAAALKPDALKGVRIGVMRWAAGWSAPVDALFEAALATLKAQGAVLVDVPAPTGTEGVGAGEYKVLVTELKAGLNAYLATTPAAVKTRTLADVIAFNKATPRELALFGQEHFTVAEATKGLDDPDYKAARAISLEAIDRCAGRHDRCGQGRGAGVADDGAGVASSMRCLAIVPAAAATPAPLPPSPAGRTSRCRWARSRACRSASASSARAGARRSCLAFGYAYEQASHKLVTPTLAGSVEAMPAVAASLAPPVK